MIKTTMTPSNSSALVRMNADGSAVLLTSSVEIGQGTQTSLAQIVAEELGIPRGAGERDVSRHRCYAV